MINKDQIETYEKNKKMFRVTCQECLEVVHGTSKKQLLAAFGQHTNSTKHKEAQKQNDLDNEW